MENLLDCLESGCGKFVYKVWILVLILLLGEKISICIDFGKSFYVKVVFFIWYEDVVDVVIWVGYFWVDEFCNYVVVMVVGDE